GVQVVPPTGHRGASPESQRGSAVEEGMTFVADLQVADDHSADHGVQHAGRAAAIDTVATGAEAAHPQLGQAVGRPEVLAVDELLALVLAGRKDRGQVPIYRDRVTTVPAVHLMSPQTFEARPSGPLERYPAGVTVGPRSGLAA